MTQQQVTKSAPLPEPLKLEYIKEIGFAHMRVADGLNTYLQLAGLVARLSQRQLDSTPSRSSWEATDNPSKSDLLGVSLNRFTLIAPKFQYMN